MCNMTWKSDPRTWITPEWKMDEGKEEEGKGTSFSTSSNWLQATGSYKLAQWVSLPQVPFYFHQILTHPPQSKGRGLASRPIALHITSKSSPKESLVPYKCPTLR